MGSQDFDQRYPAMFQPGGERHVQPATVPVSTPSPAVGSAPQAVPMEEPHDDESRDTQPTVAPESDVPWTGRPWLAGGVVNLLTFAAGVFCFLAVSVVPGGSQFDSDGSVSRAGYPWGYTLLGLAPGLLTVAVAMLAALLLLRRWYSGSIMPQMLAGFLGCAALATGMMAIAGMALWPTMYLGPQQAPESSIPLQWVLLLEGIGDPLFTLGLIILGASMILRGDGARRLDVSGRAALTVAVVMLSAAVWCAFAMSLFPQDPATATTQIIGGYEYVPTPWTYYATDAAGPLTMVAAGILLCAVVALTRTRADREEEFAP